MCTGTVSRSSVQGRDRGAAAVVLRQLQTRVGAGAIGEMGAASHKHRRHVVLEASGNAFAVARACGRSAGGEILDSHHAGKGGKVVLRRITNRSR